jgi:hypothetical protein
MTPLALFQEMGKALALIAGQEVWLPLVLGGYLLRILP